jgi:hypothetical protein
LTRANDRGGGAVWEQVEDLPAGDVPDNGKRVQVIVDQQDRVVCGGHKEQLTLNQVMARRAG